MIELFLSENDIENMIINCVIIIEKLVKLVFLIMDVLRM